jgi:tetratricopeptide (TPR) repeat protein
MNETKSHTIRLLIILVLLLAVYGIYGQILGHEFNNYDDELYITRNSLVLDGLHWENIIAAFFDTHVGHWHPITWLSHMSDVELYGLRAGGHLLTNLLLHLLNTVLLFLLLERLSGALWRSFLVTCLFAVHPLHVESVAWAAQRKDLLSTCFLFLALWTYASYARRPKLRTYLLLVFLFLLGLMSKPILVSFPLLLLLLDLWPLGRVQALINIQWESTEVKDFSKKSLALRAVWPLFREKIPLVILSLGSCLITVHAAKSAGALIPMTNYPLLHRLANASVSYATYLMKMVWPKDLAVFYPLPAEPQVTKAVGSALLILAITGIALWWWKRRPYLLVGWLWYLITLAPVIGIVQAGPQAMADRYTYISLLGPFIMLAWGGAEVLRKRRRWRFLEAAVAVSWLLALFFLACSQASYWRDSTTLFTHALSVTQGNYLAHNNLGSALYRKGKFQEAIQHYREAVRIRPGYAKAHANLGLIYMETGRWKEAQQELEQAIRLKPDLMKAYGVLADLYLRRGDPQRAITILKKALRVRPNYPLLHLLLVMAYLKLGDLEAAKAEYKVLEALDPRLARIFFPESPLEMEKMSLSLPSLSLDPSPPIMVGKNQS